MTVIAALYSTRTNSTWIGSDTRYTNGNEPMAGPPKWARYGDWAIGLSGLARALNVLQAHKNDLLHDLAGAYDFAHRFRQALLDDRFQRNPDNESMCLGQEIILAHRSTVWSIGSDFAIMEVPPDVLYADGSGGKYAKGAAFAVMRRQPKAHPRVVLETAIEAAARFDTGCDGIWTDEVR